MLNDKIIGMGCVTLIFISMLAASVYIDGPLDPEIGNIASQIVTGVMGIVVGFSIKKPKN